MCARSSSRSVIQWLDGPLDTVAGGGGGGGFQTCLLSFVLVPFNFFVLENS
jgi:hypothetical protein